MSLFRSEEMTHKKLRMPRESATEIMLALGSLKNAIEFEDLTKNNKNFPEMIDRCEEMKQKIDEFTYYCYEYNIPFKNYLSFEDFNEDLNTDIQNRDKKYGATYFDLVENEILDANRRINELMDSHNEIREDLCKLVEKKYLFKIASSINKEAKDFDAEAREENTGMQQIIGVGSADIEKKMNQVIFRVSRNNANVKFYDLEISDEEYLITSTIRERADNLGIKKSNKKVCVVTFPGRHDGYLNKKILKIFDFFQVARFQVPAASRIGKEIENITKEISDKKGLLFSIELSLKNLISECNKVNDKANLKYSMYRLYFEQEKLIYSTLNRCIIRDTVIDGRVWIPKSSVQKVEQIIKNIFNGKENQLNASLEDIPIDEDTIPPTYIPLNSFTEIFQLVVDTYGIPHYREINPGYFTIVTFPFLFGVMFGDIGHGAVLLILGLYLCFNNEKLSKSNSILKPALFARYFVLLMGFFGVFCGLLYNDFLSIPFYFSSCYPRTGSIGDSLPKDKGCHHAFGLDPVWYASSNELMFVNSLKMKLSVILGVTHMTLGIVLKGCNAWYEKDFVEFFFVFIFRLVLMTILFGYMDILIFVKWSIDYSTKHQEHLAPDIKSFLMNIFLKLGALPANPSEVPGEDWILLGSRDFLERVHFLIAVASVICILVMLVPKVIISYGRAQAKFKNGDIKGPVIAEGEELNDEMIQAMQDVQPPALSDFLVSAVIETIEFVLGTISNTASYLRLWALSLAHSQLSLVFFSKILGLCASGDSYIFNGIKLSIGYIIFAFITIGVLLFMDMMECFLHTLRLHWVEFQDKFFKADGYKFMPFCFSQSLKLEDEEIQELIKNKTRFIGRLKKN